MHSAWPRRTLAVLIVVAFAARLPRLLESLWYDEIAAWREVGVRGPLAIVTEWPDPVNHVAASLLTWVSVTLAADLAGPEISMRLPALLASLASVPLLAALGGLLGGKRVAVLAGAAAALAPVMVLEGADARGYALMMLSATASTWCLAATLSGSSAPGQPRLARWARFAYAPAAAIGVGAHPVTAVVSIGHALVLVIVLVTRRSPSDRSGAARGLTAVAVAGCVSLGLYAPILTDIVAWRSSAAATTADQPTLLGTEGAHALLQLGGAWWWWSALPAGAAAVIGLVAVARRRETWLITALALAGLPVALLIVTISGSWVYARFLLFAVPGGLLLSAMGVDAILDRWRPAGVLLVASIAAAWCADLALRPPRQPLREAAAMIAAERAPDDRVLVIGLRHQVFDVYGAALEPTYALFHGRELNAALDAVEPSWVVVLYERHVGDERMALLKERGYKLESRLDGWIDWGGGDVLVLRR